MQFQIYSKICVSLTSGWRLKQNHAGVFFIYQVGLHVPVSTQYTVVHYTHKCMCNTRAISVWRHTCVVTAAVSCFPIVAVLVSLSCTYRSFGLPLPQWRAFAVLFSASVYLQSLKMWTQEWFMFALLMNVPPFLHWIIDCFSNPQREQEKREPASESNRHCLSFYCLYSVIINRLGRFATYT